MKSILRTFLVSCLVLLAGHGIAVAADSEDAIKTRMQERLDEVAKLQVAGLVGENNKGFLEQRGALSPDQTRVMNAENTDRRALYESIASRLGYSAAEIGVQRAIQLRQLVPKGGWYQTPEGTWAKNGG